MQFLEVSGLDRFNWFSELPIQLCNINMFLIPIGILTEAALAARLRVFRRAARCAHGARVSGGTVCRLLAPGCRACSAFTATHILIIVCGLSLVTLGFYRPQFRDIPGIAGTFFLLGIGALAVNFLLRHTVCPLANYFFVYGGDVDISILNLFWKWLPVPFLYELPALLILVGYMALICRLFSAWTAAATGRAPRYKMQQPDANASGCLHFWRKKTAADADSAAVVERDTGIEPAYPAWEAGVLPMN